jgi:SpoIID/LytB domain protein
VQVGHRFVASGVAIAVVSAVVVLPVVTGPAAQVHPVEPVVTQIALAGIDPVGLRTSVPPAQDDATSRSVHVVEAVARTTAPVTPSRSLAPAVVTAATGTRPFSLVGVDWTGRTPAGTAVQVRVHENGAWSDWSPLEVVADHGPDAAEASADGVRTGTEPLMTAPGSDGVQVRVDSFGGVAPTDGRVTLVDPRTSDADALATPTAASTAQAVGDPLRPSIITRAQWGADESLRSRGPIYTGPVKVGFVHHTASTTSYTPAQATAQMRALYAWYTLGLHYSDMAYNFLVDRYGRLYEGRAGGMDRNVLGGHTAGFNQNTFAVSAIGNFDTYKPSTAEADAMVASIAKLMAWKLAINHRDPLGTATLVSDSSAGTSNYGVGQKATVPVISGHRDIGSTACPGRYLEALVPRIRTMAKADMGTQVINPVATPAVAAYGATGTVLRATTTTKVAWKLEVFSVCQNSPIRVLTGTQMAAGGLAVAWDQKRSDGKAALPGTYRLVLSASTGAAVAYPAETAYVVTPTSTSPMGPCDKAARFMQSERYSAAVAAGRLAAPSSRTVVLANGDDVNLPEALMASPLAAALGAPRLLTASAALPAATSAEIARRKPTTAYLVGSTTQITAAVAAQLKALGVTNVVRLTGADRAATAAAVAGAMGARPSAVVVSLDAGASLDAATVAAADAAVAKRPLLVVTKTRVPAATTAALAAMKATSVVVAAPVAVVSDAVVAALPGGRRVAGATDAGTSSALAAVIAPSATSVSVLLAASPGWRAVAASTGRPLIVSATVSPVTGWLTNHRPVKNALAVGGWTDASIGAFAAVVGTGTVATTPPPAPVPTPSPSPSTTTPTPAAVPASFSFNGAGSGHGVGMSQWGAYGMAVAGSSAAQIVQHYYTGTTVTPVTDTANIRVNIAHTKPAVYFRSESLASGGGGIEVTVTGAPVVLGNASDVFAAKNAAGKVRVTRTRAGVTTLVGTGAAVVVRWSGTRAPGKAGTAATVLDVATSVTGLSGTGHRYRYGWLDIAPAAATPTTLEAVNTVRIHDEYLLGIGEVSSSWPAAALQAQVLAARTYAMVRTASRSACRCQVDDGHGPYFDQTFAGWTKESGPSGAKWRAAVIATQASATTGRAILSAGKPITAFYFAASGGRTQNVQDVWVTTLPYVQSVADPWSMAAPNPWRAWVPRVRTQAQVAAAFGLPNVVRIDFSSRTVGGGVKVAVAYSSTGTTASLKGESLRTKLTLPSTWVWRAVATYSGDPALIAAATAKASVATAVVLAPSDAPAVVAVASSLAARKGIPLLLTPRTRLPAVTRTELVRRKATTVYAVGTAVELPAAVVTAVDVVAGTVTRVTGATDTDVSIAAANLVALPSGGRAFVAAADDPVDAAIAGAAAGATKRPLLLLPAGGAPSTAVSAYLDAHSVAGTAVIGSVAAIPAATAGTLRGWNRIAGTDATNTSVRVATAFVALSGARVSLATSTGYLAALAAAQNAPLLVIGTTLTPATLQLLQRGVSTLVVTPGITAALAVQARRA